MVVMMISLLTCDFSYRCLYLIVTAAYTDLVTSRRDDTTAITPTEVVNKETPIPEEELETLVDEVDIPGFDSMIEEQRNARNAEDLA